MKIKLVRIKIFQPAEPGLLGYPTRYRFSNYWKYPNGRFVRVGSEISQTLKGTGGEIIEELGEECAYDPDTFEYLD